MSYFRDVCYLSWWLIKVDVKGIKRSVKRLATKAISYEFWEWCWKSIHGFFSNNRFFETQFLTTLIKILRYCLVICHQCQHGILKSGLIGPAKKWLGSERKNLFCKYCTLDHRCAQWRNKMFLSIIYYVQKHLILID